MVGLTKTLYVKRFGISEVKKQIRRLKQQQDAYYTYKLAYGKPVYANEDKEYNFLKKYYHGKREDWENAKHWFGRTKNTSTKLLTHNLYYNIIAESLANRLVLFLNEMKKEEENLQADNQQYGQTRKRPVGQRSLECQLSWFRKEYCVGDGISFADKEKSKKEFIDFFKSYADSGKQIENQDLFKKKFINLHDKAFGRVDKNKNRSYGIKKMNIILEEKR